VRTNDLTYDTTAEKEFSTLINSIHKDTGTFFIDDDIHEEDWTHGPTVPSVLK
jgi:hypothetical protein